MADDKWYGTRARYMGYSISITEFPHVLGGLHISIEHGDSLARSKIPIIEDTCRMWVKTYRDNMSLEAFLYKVRP